MGGVAAAQTSPAEAVFSEATEVRFQTGADPLAASGLLRAATERSAPSDGGLAAASDYADALVGLHDAFWKLQRQRDQGLELQEQLVLDLQNCDHALAEAHEALRAAFAEVREQLAAGRNALVFLERHDAAVGAHQAAHDVLTAVLEDFRAAGADVRAREEALDLLAVHFQAHPVSLAVEPPSPAAAVRAVAAEAPVLDLSEVGLSPLGFALPRAQAIRIPKSPPVPGDLEESLEVQFTPEIEALAESLDGSALRIFQHVRSSIDFDPYVGSRRGAAETLRLGSGNDLDQASLLIALLRSSGIPARYATGTVEMSPEAAMNWLGVADATTAASILTTAGLEGVAIQGGGRVTAVRCRRIWVEAHVPYSDYRGAGAGEGEPLWVPLDPAFKAYENRIGVDPVVGTPFDAAKFLEGYFESGSPTTVVEYFQAEVTRLLAARAEPLTPEANRLERTILPENLPWLPASLPNRTLTRDQSWSEVPDTLRFKLQFHLSGAGSVLDHTLTLASVAGKQVTYSYVGATAADRTVIADHGGFFGISAPWTIQVVPELRVNGCVVATGTGGVTLGTIQTSEISFTSPGPEGSTQKISNSITAGNDEGLAFSTGVVKVDFGNRTLDCPEKFTGEFLHRLGMLYLQSNDEADREIAGALQSVIYKDVDNAILSQQVKVAYSGTTPLYFRYGGLFVDADRTSGTSFSAYGHPSALTFARLRGAQGSQNENLVFETNLGKEAVSSIKIFQVAQARGIPLVKMTPANAASLLPTLNQPSQLVNSLIGHLNAGDEILVPRDPLTYFNWRGTGYVNFNPLTGSGGYIISGGLSGGATAEEEEKGPGCERVSNVVITPQAPGNSYSSCSTTPVTITVTLVGVDEECETVSTRTQKRTIDPRSTAPGKYDFKFGSAGECGCGEITVTIIIEEGAVLFADRTGRVSVGGRLEIANRGAEDITADALKGDASTQWRASGPVTPSIQLGQHATFSVQEPAPPFLNFVYLLNDPPVTTIEATNLAESCGTSVRVYAYPANKTEYKLNLFGGRTAEMRSQFGKLADIFEYLQGFREITSGLATFARAVHSPIIPPEPFFEGGFNISDSFKEQPDSHMVEYALGFGVWAEAGMKGEFVLGTGFLGVPPPLAEAAVFFPYKGAIGTTLGGEVVFTPPGNWTKSKLVDRRVYGVIVVGVGGKVSVASGLLQLQMVGSTQLKLEGGVSLNVEGRTVDIGGEIQLIVGGLELAYEASAFWGIWSGTTTWEVLQPWKFPDGDPYRISFLNLTAPR